MNYISAIYVIAGSKHMFQEESQNFKIQLPELAKFELLVF